MKIVVLPGFSELIVKVNPAKAVTRDGLLNATMPWQYAPWPEAQKTGMVEVEFKGENLKDLLIEVGNRYESAGVDFKPFNNDLDQLDFDYDVFVNGKNYLMLSDNVNTKLNPDDEVKIKVMWRWDG
jgi:hypothetical protein